MKRLLILMVLGLLAACLYWGAHEEPAPPAVVEVPYYAPPGPDDVRFDPPAAASPREAVGDIPVPIVPGTRVTEAEARPPQPPRPRRSTVPPQPLRPFRRVGQAAPRPPASERVIAGRLSATEERARDDARLQLERVLGDWLQPDVPASWKTPRRLVDELTTKVEVTPVEKELGTLYEATIRADLSSPRRAQIVHEYHRDLVEHRLSVLAGVVAFVLACLAALAGYIKADEATKGYYTNRLRVVAAAGVGAAGVLIYQVLS